MTIGVQLPELDAQPEVKFLYREAVGSLLFAAMVTRFHIANAVSQWSQHLRAFGKEHIAVVKRIMRYLRGTININIVEENVNLIGFKNDGEYGDGYRERNNTVGTASCKLSNEQEVTDCENENNGENEQEMILRRNGIKKVLRNGEEETR